MREEEILALLRARDEAGMEEMLKHYGPLMRYIIAPILRDAHDREDCLSEAAVRVWENFDTYDDTRGSLAAWITAVTRNTALNMIRRNNRQQTDEIAAETPSPAPTPEEIILQKERTRVLSQAVDTLRPRDRNLFYRKYYYLQSTARIAAELGMTERAVEGRLYRIKKKLRSLMGGDGNEV